MRSNTRLYEGTEKYAAAISSLFNPQTARADLLSCSVSSPNTIELAWRLEGTITQGGIPFKFKPYTGKTVYTASEETGRIVSQAETWDVSQLDVFVSLFFPSFGAPPAPRAEVLRSRM